MAEANAEKTATATTTATTTATATATATANIINNYTIFGERCSGTNYLEQLMKTNFDIPITWEYGHKHFFGHRDFSTIDTSSTLFLCIVRNPITWLNSFFKEQHHVPNRPLPLDQFLFSSWQSVDASGEIIPEDTRLPLFSTAPAYKNIFEMRFYKHYYLLNILPTQVPHCMLINYELLRDNTAAVLQSIAERFNLPPPADKIYKNVTYYKDLSDVPYNKPAAPNIIIPKSIIFLCWKYLNLQQEARLGYNMPPPMLLDQKMRTNSIIGTRSH